MPTEVTVWVTDPRVTLASRYDGPDELVIAMATPPPIADGDNRGNADDDDPLAATATPGHSLTHPYCSMLRRIARGRSRRSCSQKTMPG